MIGSEGGGGGVRSSRSRTTLVLSALGLEVVDDGTEDAVVEGLGTLMTKKTKNASRE